MARILALVLAVIVVFAAVAAVLAKVMPGPLQESDYLVIGSVATLVSLLTLFFALVTTSVKAPGLFFKRRKKRP